MIDWKQCIAHRHCFPTFLMSNLLITNQLYCLCIPCHSQSVERGIKDITAASLKVYSHMA